MGNIRLSMMRRHERFRLSYLVRWPGKLTTTEALMESNAGHSISNEDYLVSPERSVGSLDGA
jgi:hypothetical protein